MAFAVLHINDQSLQVKRQDGALQEQPGYARITDSGIETGEAARATAWLEPQNSHNQYWCHLNQAPLAAGSRWARHHADIAFAQLKQLLQSAGNPGRLALVVPGSFDDGQLSLLLGMLSAIPVETVSVVDSALAAGDPAVAKQVVIDLQLHQAVISTVVTESGESLIAAQEVLPNLGVLQIFNSVARHVSNLLIDSARFDPSHSSECEQFMFDHLPDWITRLRFEREISQTMPTSKGELPFILRRERIAELLEERLVSARHFIDRYRDARLALTPASGMLAALTPEFAAAEILGSNHIVERVLAEPAFRKPAPGPLYRMRAFEHGLEPDDAPPVNGRSATHLLHEDRAIPLSQPLSIRLDGEHASCRQEMDKQAAIAFVVRDGRYEELARDASVDVQMPDQFSAGESIRVGNQSFRLIEVER